MAKSSSKISGFHSRTILTASAPSQASPIPFKPYQHMLGSAVLAHVDKSLLYDAGKFAANLLRHIQLVHLAYKAGRNSCFSLEPFDGIGEKRDNPAGIHIQRFHLLH